MSPAQEAQVKRLCQYIRNTAQVPLAVADFDDDHEPVGPMLRGWLLEAGAASESDDGLRLTPAGEAML